MSCRLRGDFGSRAQVLSEGHCAYVGILLDCLRFSCAPANVIVVGIICATLFSRGVGAAERNRAYGIVFPGR